MLAVSNLIDGMSKKWPRNFVRRSEVAEFTDGLISPRTLAADDGAGRGPSDRFLIGRVVAYTKDSMVAYLHTKNRIAE